VECLDKLRLARTEGVGPVTYRRLMARFETAAAAIEALPDIARAGGRETPPLVPSRRDASRELDRVEAIGGRMVFAGDADYPPLLALLPDPPPALTILGDMAALRGRAVGVVGARNASANGQRMAEALATDLAAQNLVVVSGLARGIDAAAHRGALHVGLTVAAVAGGIDQPYPPEHAGLQAEIAARGAVITEAPFGTAPQSRHFPRRNRLIAGLSLGLVVVEAAPRSGSLITARLAQEANREIFAVPGSPLDQRCRGTNDLIRQGAHLTESADDVLANLPDDPRRAGLARTPLFARQASQGFGDDIPLWEDTADPEIDIGAAQTNILGLLSPSPTHLDDLVRRSGLPAAAVSAALMHLELALRVEFMPGNRVCRV
jgi:DNA processing protein